jgi:ribonuclease-3
MGKVLANGEMDFSRLSQQLGYRFAYPEHLLTALTHRSAGSPNNERLEFLGDAILSYIVAEHLLERFPQAREGELTRLRAHIVKGDTLAEVAKRLDLGQYLRLGGGELKSGGWRRESILADALEAVIGAVYLDGGMEPCKNMLLRLLDSHIRQLTMHNLRKDSKTQLQEYLQARHRILPSYQVTAVEGAAHEQYFCVECLVPGLPAPTRGEGKSRRYAEQEAAEKALALLTTSASTSPGTRAHG